MEAQSRMQAKPPVKLLKGIDGTIKEDKLGLDIIYIQAKRWQAGNVVGRPELHKFVGALAGTRRKKGNFYYYFYVYKRCPELCSQERNQNCAY